MTITEDLVVMFGGLGLIVVCVLFTMLHQRWTRLVQLLLDFRKYGKPQDFSQTVNYCNTIVKYFTMYFAMGATGYAVKSTLGVPFCEKLKKEKCPGFICSYFTLWTPFHISSKFIRDSMFILQFITSILVVVPAPTIVVFTWEVIKLFATILNHFKNELIKCLQIEDSLVRRRKFRLWIQSHIHFVE